MDITKVNEELKGKRLHGVTAHIDSERGIYELRLDFEDGHYLEVSPQGFGLLVSGAQEYVGPPRP